MRKIILVLLIAVGFFAWKSNQVVAEANTVNGTIVIYYYGNRNNVEEVVLGEDVILSYSKEQPLQTGYVFVFNTVNSICIDGYLDQLVYIKTRSGDEIEIPVFCPIGRAER